MHMGTLLAIDPGLRACGVALFQKASLQAAAYVRCKTKFTRGYIAYAAMAQEINLWVLAHGNFIEHIDTIAIEMPRIYPGGKGDSKNVDPNDVLDVAAVGAALTGVVCANLRVSINDDCIPPYIRSYFPSEWKGQVPKDVMNRRVLSKLNHEEQEAIIRVGAKDHNTLDAIGIGLHYLGRL